MVFTDHDELASTMKSIRVHGMGTDKYDTVRIGLNARLDTLQAAILLAKFDHFPDEIGKRQEAAAHYDRGLKNLVTTPKILGHNRSVYAQYSIRHPRRDQLKAHIEKEGIPTAIHYAKPLHLQKGLAYLGYKSGSFPVAESVSGEILALPMHPFLTKEEQDHIINAIQKFYSH
jgi:UDP-2-acetamido-2-deoxy-ribo-hexuluronate aminotransferase